ncbi:LLM class flavin-dependent oxidoreductase [Aurantimicrobium minutum]|uniref:LLM class flavin-dependent oxidoreductase n=1 Tax=Aurantimicrobium minutum TaxID=708131 RepID=UPI00247521BC|nr:LLM class flavin-dependent oxidoreductase [Aurantimicrobium minutum]MDH6422287.1 putative LLM family oxidoreductase [Aurantimicrobium minutum]
MAQNIEFGLDTFGDVTVDPNGVLLSQAQVLRNVAAEAVLADELGLQFFGIGEHHRDDFAVSSPEVLLGAIAAQTKNIHLGSAVTVLSSDDPIRVFQRFSTLDALSNGRAEVMVGRGSFTESFPLFGFELQDYDKLFEEKLDLFARLVDGGPISWEGTIRPALREQMVYPTVEGGKLKTWIGVGGSPQSVVRAAQYGLPLMLAIIGGDPLRFRPFVDLYHHTLEQLELEPLPIGQHSPGFVAETDDEAKDMLFPHFQVMRERVGRSRGWPALTRAEFEQEAGPEGALFVGSPETVAKKLARSIHGLGISRFDLKYSAGTLPHEYLMKSIRLYGEVVVPLVRELLFQLE